MQSALGTFGLTGLDRLFSFMVVSNLQKVCAFSARCCRPAVGGPMLLAPTPHHGLSSSLQFTQFYTRHIKAEHKNLLDLQNALQPYKSLPSSEKVCIGRCRALLMVRTLAMLLLRPRPRRILTVSPPILGLPCRHAAPGPAVPGSDRCCHGRTLQSIDGAPRTTPSRLGLSTCFLRFQYSHCFFRCVLQIGQIQLIRRMVSTELNFAAKFDGKMLLGCVSATVGAGPRRRARLFPPACHRVAQRSHTPRSPLQRAENA